MLSCYARLARGDYFHGIRTTVPTPATKGVPKDRPTPPKASLNDPFTPKTMELLTDNSGDQARWFMQFIRGLRTQFSFRLRNQMRNPLLTWQQGDRICPPHFVSRSEERAALILDTLNPESRAPVESSSHPRSPPPRPLPPPDADQPTLTQIDRHNYDRRHIWLLGPLLEAQYTDGQSKYSLLPPLAVPHRSTPCALNCTSINCTSRRSISAPVHLPHNAIPPRSSLLVPPPPHRSPRQPRGRTGSGPGWHAPRAPRGRLCGHGCRCTLAVGR